jgi:hypothetical protein
MRMRMPTPTPLPMLLSPSRKPVQPPAKGAELREDFGGLRLGKVAPGDGELEGDARFAEGAVGALKSKARVARLRAKPFRGIERNTAERTPCLRREIAVAPRDNVDQGPRLRDDANDLFEKLVAKWCVHDHPPQAQLA